MSGIRSIAINEINAKDFILNQFWLNFPATKEIASNLQKEIESSIQLAIAESRNGKNVIENMDKLVELRKQEAEIRKIEKFVIPMATIETITKSFLETFPQLIPFYSEILKITEERTPSAAILKEVILNGELSDYFDTGAHFAQLFLDQVHATIKLALQDPEERTELEITERLERTAEFDREFNRFLKKIVEINGHMAKHVQSLKLFLSQILYSDDLPAAAKGAREILFNGQAAKLLSEFLTLLDLQQKFAARLMITSPQAKLAESKAEPQSSVLQFQMWKSKEEKSERTLPEDKLKMTVRS